MADISPFSLVNDFIKVFRPTFDALDSTVERKTNVSKFASKYKDSLSGGMGRSIRSRASKYILQFPIITSDNVSFDALNIIRKNLEIRNTNDIITYLNNQPATAVQGDGSDDRDTNSEFALSDVHTNLPLESLNTTIPFNTLKSVNESLLNTTFEDMFNTTSLNEATLPKSVIQEKNFKEQFNEDASTAKVLLKNKCPNKLDLKCASDIINRYDGINGKIPNDMVEALKKWYSYYNSDPKKIGVKNIINESDSTENLPLFTYLEDNTEKDAQDALDRYHAKKLAGNRPTRTGEAFIKSKDVKQLNDYQPVYAKAQRTYVVGNQNITKDVNFAVKMVTHPVSSNELVKTLSNRARNSNFLSMIVRWTSGEIKLFSDIIFNMKGFRQIASNRSRGGRALGSLSSHKETDFLQRVGTMLFKMGDNPETAAKVNGMRVIPNAALIVSREDIEKVRYETGVDLIFNTNEAFSIMKNYFLIDFVIIDEPEDMVYFYNIFAKTFDRYQLSALQTVVERADTGTPNRPVTDGKLKSFLMGIRNASKN